MKKFMAVLPLFEERGTAFLFVVGFKKVSNVVTIKNKIKLVGWWRVLDANF